jgi:hypothetical protein
MRNFSRSKFQLRTTSLETRIAYTAFLVLTTLGVATLLALSVGRVGFSPGAIAAYYRGGESEMSFPKTFWQLMEVSHFHLFSVPTVVLILTHLLYATPTSVRFRVWLTVLTFVGAFLEAVGPWAVRYVAAACAYLLLAGWALLAGGTLVIVVVTIASMWGPEGWVGEPDAALGGGER